MVGVIIRCRIPLNGATKQCHVKLSAREKAAREAASGNRETEPVWLALEGGAYVSTGHNAGGIDYKFGRIGMFAFEPMLEFRYAGDIVAAQVNPAPKTEGKGAVYGGVGPMINSFIVRGSTPAFAKYGVKFRPIAIAFAGWGVEYNIRLYPDGFTPDQFGFGPRMKFNRPFEAVQSIGISVPWLTWKLGH
jgi:hypothetical protein